MYALLALALLGQIKHTPAMHAADIPGGATIPATCTYDLSLGLEVWWDSDAAAGSRYCVCTATDTWTCIDEDGAAGGNNDLLDGSVHQDTAAGTVVRGDIVVGNVTPAWSRLGIGAASTFLYSDGTDASWSEITLGTDTAGTYADGTAEAGAALTGDSATAFFAAGEVEDARIVDALTIAGGTIGTSGITLNGGTAPTTDGLIEWDTTAETIKVGDDGAATLEFFPGAHTAAAAGAGESGTLFSLIGTTTVNTTTAATTILGTKSGSATLAANFLTVGMTVKGIVTGVLSRASGAFSIDVDLGGVTLVTVGVPTTFTSATIPIRIDFEFTCRVAGATGDVYGSIGISTSSSGFSGESFNAVGSDLSVDTTGTLALDVTIQPSVSAAGNGIVTDLGVVTWSDPTP